MQSFQELQGEKRSLSSINSTKKQKKTRVGKTRDLFKKIGDIKGIFHARMGTITEAEETKWRWQEYTEELYRKGLNDPDNQDDVVTQLELGILEYKVRWALGSITTNKASEGDGTSAELFRILKDDVVKVLHSICQQIWKNSAVATGLENVSFHYNPKEIQCQRMFKFLDHCTHFSC